jgi:hypothetical protein
MKYGIYQRTKPRVNVLRGFTGNESSGLTKAARITDGVTILSGQIISLTNGEWVLGGQAGKPVFIAMHDSVDTDVVSSGLLLGLSCSGNFEVQTAYFESSDTYADGTALTYDGTTGQIKITTLGAATQTDVIGYCTSAKVNLDGTDSQSLPCNGDGSVPTNGAIYVVQWITRWLPKREVTAST